MRYWIDLEDSTGARVGDGPLIRVGAWTHTARLDRAGTFSFTMAATDPRAAQVRVKRVARCWSMEGGVLRAHGAGIIDNIETTIGPDAAPLLVVSGDDLLRELAYRGVGNLQLVDVRTEHAGDTLADATYMNYADDLTVGDTTTYHTGIIFSDGGSIYGNVHMYIKAVTPFNSVHFVLNPGGTNSFSQAAINLTYEYYNLTSAAWQALPLTTDGTEVANTKFAQSGTVTFGVPAGWGPVSGEILYAIRIHNTTDETDAIEFCDIAVTYEQPTAIALGPIMAFAPAGWSLDLVNGYADIGAATQLGSELLSNGTFEAHSGSGPVVFTDWTNSVPAGTDVTTDTAYAGSAAIKLTGLNNSTASTYQDVTVDANTDYILTFYGHGDGTNQGRITVTDVTGAALPMRTIATGSGTGYALLSFLFTTASITTSVRIKLLAPYVTGASYAVFDNVSLKRRLGGEILQTFSDDSVLSALVTVAEHTGEHFTLSPNGREVLWLRTSAPDSGIRAISADGGAGPDNDNVCLITELSELHNAYDCITRVRAYGGGVGDARVDLTSCTRSAPTGYVLDKTTGWLSCTAAETALGRIERVLDYPDINALDTTPAQLTFAANQVFDRAYNYLITHTATETDRTAAGYDVPRAYRLTVTKLNRPLLPGYKLRIVYRRVVGSYVAIDIDQECYVLSSTVQVDASGIRTVALEVSTVQTPIISESEYVAKRLAQAQAARAHAIAEGGLNDVSLGAPTQLAVRDGRIVGITR